jgi:hypothetical protein
MLSGNWTFIEPGFTGIAIPCEAQVGTTHGVYVLEDPSGLKKQYEQGLFPLLLILCLILTLSPNPSPLSSHLDPSPLSPLLSP